MSIEYVSAEPPSLDALQDLHPEEIDPAELMLMRDVSYDGLQLLLDLRRDPDARHRIDGFMAANVILPDGRTLDELGAARGPAEASGPGLEKYFLNNVDMSHAQAPVRDKRPGESIGDYMNYMATVLQKGQDHPQRISLPYPADVPGSRFIHAFPPDNDMVIMGKVAIGDLEGAHRTLDNSMYLVQKFGGLLPNFNGPSALDRANPLTTSYAVERLAAAYGKDGDEVIAHYREPLTKQIDFWQRGRSYLKDMPHDRGATYGRQILLPGRSHDIVYRHYSDVKTNLATMQGLRPESAAEDEELAIKVLADLTGEAAEQRYGKLMRDVRAACEWQDFADWEFADYRSLEKIRTTDIAPVHLQANMVHNLRMVGRFEEANELANIINRRFWVDIDETHGYYADLLSDGTPTKALHAAQALVLLAGGIVPYDRTIKLANTIRDGLLRRYGFLISAGTAPQQWAGSPSETGEDEKDDFVRRIQMRMYGEVLVGEEKDEDRAWPAVGALLVEAFIMSATEAQANGNDTGPLREIAELARIGTVEGIENAVKKYNYVGEKYCATDPKKFVNGGEYGRTPETAQRGFGMTIGAYRSLAGRGLQAEIMYPREYSWRQYTLRHSLGGLLIASA